MMQKSLKNKEKEINFNFPGIIFASLKIIK